MDPLRILPSNCMQQIFSFFQGKELLALTTVNKNWHDEITSSSKLMSSIKLELHSAWMEEEDSTLKEIAEMSDRAYSRIFVAEVNAIMPSVNEIMSNPCRRWKTVEFYHGDFMSSKEVEKFVENFEESVENLVLHQMAVHDNVAVKFNDFKNLKKLTIFYVDSLIFGAIFNSASNLKSLELASVDNITKSSIIALKNLVNLKELVICIQWLTELVRNNEGIKFQLENFRMIPPYDNYEEFNEKFLEFLKTQKKLKKISLTEWFDFPTLDEIFQMKNLTHLNLYHVPEFGWDGNLVSVSKTIETLDIRMIYIESNANNIQNLLFRVPNVKHLKLRFINESVATFLSLHLTNLESISLVHQHSAESIRYIFPSNVQFISI